MKKNRLAQITPPTLYHTTQNFTHNNIWVKYNLNFFFDVGGSVGAHLWQIWWLFQKRHTFEKRVAEGTYWGSVRSTELTPKISDDPMLRICFSQLLEKKSWSGGTSLLRSLVFCVSNLPPISSYICPKWPHFRAHFERLFADNLKNMSRMNPKFFSGVSNSMLK